MDRRESGRRPFSVAGMPLEAVSFLGLTVIIALLYSHVHLLWADEFCSLYADQLPSIGAVAHYQATTPMSLDPMVYNSLAHFAVKALGPIPLALRLPSLCGFVLMQVCVFYFVRRIAGVRAATLALALPALLGPSTYAVQGRRQASMDACGSRRIDCTGNQYAFLRRASTGAVVYSGAGAELRSQAYRRTDGFCNHCRCDGNCVLAAVR